MPGDTTRRSGDFGDLSSPPGEEAGGARALERREESGLRA